jgi:adenine phosphoribosyltransferase
MLDRCRHRPSIASHADWVQDRLRRTIEFIGGHADVWAVFRDGELLADVVDQLSAPFRSERVTKVAGVEARGFILGASVATALGAGFVAVRKAEGLFPGPKVERVTESPDYRGQIHRLRMQSAAVSAGDRVLVVDDWVETGNQAVAVASMIAECGASLIGVSVVVDQLTDERRAQLGRVHSLVRADDLNQT